jgi:hypothetical protein
METEEAPSVPLGGAVPPIRDAVSVSPNYTPSSAFSQFFSDSLSALLVHSFMQSIPHSLILDHPEQRT